MSEMLPPEASQVKVLRLVRARTAILQALDESRSLSLARAAELAGSHRVRLEDILGRLELDCSIDWEAGLLKCP